MGNLLRVRLRSLARAGERVGKGGDGTYVGPTNLRRDCTAVQLDITRRVKIIVIGVLMGKKF